MDNDFNSVEVLEESALAAAQALIQLAIKESDHGGVIKRALSKRFAARMEGSHNLTVKELQEALVQCGFEIRFSKVRIPPR
jgi:hypothetical protein